MGVSGSHRQEQRGSKTGHPAILDHVAATQGIPSDLCNGIAEQKHADMTTPVVLPLDVHGTWCEVGAPGNKQHLLCE